ncbi:sugar ABC transporter substrate-binding protein [Actinospica durhamensis]|uniref:Sugar ABC transporter substrate-binding protein n=1 Tax=Actinospica durhamensis TaxID=1508375 RepID=A0A941EM81_9ACTN|nr:sugar ABC transporter substrate-binding protein [Actinospica durhamensis]MBR7833545.1 sugar ABC transporter substrate-binding protein [Actinospica durhamensis]
MHKTARHHRFAALAAVIAAALALSSCSSSSGGGGSSSPTGSISGQTITYWASDQGSSIADDVQVLTPELNAFTKQTGVKVDLQVIGWNDLLNRILAATASGQGPDVVNIGNTWSASLQATGAFLPITSQIMSQIGDTGRFLPGALAATGAAGKPPVGVPIYSTAYGLYYNKVEFAAAGITSAPTTWEQLIADGQKLTHGSQWGLTLEAAQTPENAHAAFVFSEQQGGSWFDSSGNPTFTTPANVAAIKELVGFMGTDKITNPSDAENSNGTEALQEFASGKAAMLMWQPAGANLAKYGMQSSAYGVAPLPFPATAPAGAQHIDSMVGGINLSVFANTKHEAAALAFVKFMTSQQTEISLNKTYGSLPSVTDAYTDPAFQTADDKVFQNVLASSATAMPEIAQESQFETVIGAALKTLYADAASGTAITDSLIQSTLNSAQQQMAAGG